MAENDNLDMLKEVVNMDLIYWSVRLCSSRGGDEVKWVDGGYHYFSQLKVSLYYMKIRSNILAIMYISIPLLFLGQGTM